MGFVTISSVYLLSHIRLFATSWTAAHQASLSITNSWSCSNSHPSSQLSHPTISSSSIPFFSCLQYFPAVGFFPRSQFFILGGQSIGVSASASVLPMNIQDGLPLGWTGWISLQYKDSQESSPTSQLKSNNSSALSFPYSPTLTSLHSSGCTVEQPRRGNQHPRSGAATERRYPTSKVRETQARQ